MAKCCEYTQDVDKMKVSIEEMKKILNEHCYRWAYIIHDHDVKRNKKDEPILDKEGNTIQRLPHIHVMMDLTTDNDYPIIAKWFKDEPQQIQSSKARGKTGKYAFNNMLSYLLHETPAAQAAGKHRYDEHDVTANFDFLETIEKIRNDVKKAEQKNEKKQSINKVLADICNNKIPKLKIDDYLTEIEQIENKNKIAEAFKIRDRRLLNDRSRNMNTIYITGEPGIGKGVLAEQLAKQYGSVYESGASNDALDGYEGQECIILNEVRGMHFDMADFLKFIEPYSATNARSRYQNKLMIDCKCIILTSVETIEEFYKGLQNKGNYDPIKQLKRRIKTYIKAYENHYLMYRYSTEIGDYDTKNVIILPNETKKWIEKYGYKDKEIFDTVDNAIIDMYKELGIDYKPEIIDMSQDIEEEEDDYIKEQEEYIKEAQRNIQDYIEWKKEQMKES